MSHCSIIRHRIEHQSLIAGVAATLFVFSSTSATAQITHTKTDPAIVACSIFILGQLPKAANYSIASAAISNTDVSLLLQSKKGLPTTLSKTCHFIADKDDGKFRLARVQSQEAKDCTEHVDRITALIRAGALERAKQQKGTLERCQSILKRELKTEAEFATHTFKLIDRPNYPIDPKDTALR